MGSRKSKVLFLAMVLCWLISPAIFAQQAQSVVCTIDMHKVLEAYMKIPGITSKVAAVMDKTLDASLDIPVFSASQTGKILASGEAEVSSKDKKEKPKTKKEAAETQRTQEMFEKEAKLIQEKQLAMSDFGAQVLKEIRSAVTTAMQKYGAQILINTTPKNSQDFFQVFSGSMKFFSDNLNPPKLPKNLQGMTYPGAGGMPPQMNGMPGMGQGGFPGGMPGGGPGAGGMPPQMGGMPGMGQGGPGGMPGMGQSGPPQMGGMPGAGGMPEMGQGGPGGMPGGNAPGMGQTNNSQFTELINWLAKPVPVSQGKDITDEVVEILTQMKR